MHMFSSAEELGAIIREERKRQGLTQTDLAQYCDVGLNFVSNVERGKETAELGKVLRLTNALGLGLAAEKRSTWRRVSAFIERKDVQVL